VNVLTEHCNQMYKTHVWQFAPSGRFSTKSAYEAMFIGAIEFKPWERIWRSWAPGKCKFFMWLVAHDRCWTADRLEKRGLPHPQCCPLCDQEDKTINDLLVACVFSRQAWCDGQRDWEGWKKEFSEDCIQRRWSDVVLDLDGAAEQQAAHDAPGRHRHERPRYKINLSLILPLLCRRLI
jgi:hypothetical protein